MRFRGAPGISTVRAKANKNRRKAVFFVRKCCFIYCAG
jgi:hypothetical protein